mmetsp:Transcript_40400/g.66349  ORF Transcript_40400/g.66349 Transcript_40400/m.66349 type:complete len:555 (-) Transcript_40400:146-1810(-)
MSCIRNIAIKHCKHNPSVVLNGSCCSVRALPTATTTTKTAHRQFSNGLHFDFSDSSDSGFASSAPVNSSRQRAPSFGGGNNSYGGGGFGGNNFGGGGSYGGSSFGGKERKSWNKAQIQWSEEDLVPFTKNFYAEHPELAKMSEAQVDEFRKQHAMIIHGTEIPKPFNRFENSGLPEICVNHLHKLNISAPSPIQQQGIPMALSGRDVIGISRTGSGKTLAYLLPLIVHIQAQPVVKRGEGPIGLIVAPTRELTLQINNEIEKYIQSNPDIQLKTTAVYGGSDRHKQIYSLRQSPDILVATPGRLLDLLECGETNFKRTTYCVLDEADRMLDMGFRDDLENILSYIRPDKQTLMWSATWPKEIQQIASSYMSDPIRVQIGSTELHANSNIEQCFRALDSEHQKVEKFMTDMEEISGKQKKCLVFTNTKRNADMLVMRLQSMQVRSAAIHGDKTQQMRERTLSGFRRSEIQVLIATDVVARGIDISDIAVVLCYDFPTDVESYIHRIGRTGRGDNKGIALSYMTRAEIANHGKKLETVLKRSKQKIPQFLQQKSMF